VAITISATKLTDGVIPGGNTYLSEVRAAGGGERFELQTLYSTPIYDFVPGRAVEVRFVRILGVPAGTEALDVQFVVDNRAGFRLRGCPIVWTGTPRQSDGTVTAQASPSEVILSTDRETIRTRHEVDAHNVSDVDWEFEATQITTKCINRY
jgi:hypothetical protein